MKSPLAAVFQCLLFVGLSACAAKSVPTSQELRPTETEGILLVSISQQGWRKVVATVAFRDADGENVQFIATPGGMGSFYTSDSDRDDFNTSDGRGQVYALKLKPGNYEVHRWSVDTGHAVYTPSEEFSLPFTITSGKSTYIGDFHFAVGRGENLFGIPLPYLDGVEYRNSWERDLAALRTKYRGVSLQEVDFSALVHTFDVDGEDGPDRRVNMPLFVPQVGY